MTKPRTALVVSAHGSPETLDELPEFLKNIRRGRPASPEVLAEVRRRYEAIGGRSPLADITNRQAAALSARMKLPARVAMRLFRPYPGDVVADLVREGYEQIVSVPLAPYSVHVYHDAIAEALAAAGTRPQLVRVAPWNLEPALVQGLASAVDQVVARLATSARSLLVLTAHSLPVRVIEGGDPYASLVADTAHAVVASLAHPMEHRLAYQSQGMTSDAWLGPDLHQILRDARAGGFTDVVVSPIGFLADHIEILYDLDIEAAGWARSLGLAFHRPATLNESPPLIDALESAVRRALA